MITLDIGTRHSFLHRMLRVSFILAVCFPVCLLSARAETRTVKSTVLADPHTGKLVRRTTVAASASAMVPKSAQLTELIDTISRRNEVEPPLVHSLIQAESSYNPLAVSNKGAQGLMQLIPATARRFGVTDSFDMQQNIDGGTKYLKYLINLFHGDYARAVAAYNAGEAAVTKYGGVPPYRETRNYVAAVSRGLEQRRLAIAGTAAPADSTQVSVSAEAPADTAETANPIIASITPDGRVLYRTP